MVTLTTISNNGRCVNRRPKKALFTLSTPSHYKPLYLHIVYDIITG